MTILCRQGMADYLPDAILQTPLQTKEVFQFIIDNEDIVYDQRSFYAKMYLELYSFQMIREKYGQRPRSDEKDFPNTIILDFNDFHQDTELVYSISINHAEKYVLVTFRGSLTMQDWKTNFSPAMKVIENPIRELRNEIPTLQIHAGFYDYLFKLFPKPTIQKLNANNISKDSDVVEETIENDQSTSSKFQVIFEQLSDLFLEYPEYRLYATGHSLGGALSIIFAWRVACWSLPNSIEGDELRIPIPVTCVTFASPKVGNIDFCKSFNHLEKKGVIRLIRITNCYDLVPRLPIRAHNDWCFVCRLRNVYIHVGIHIELKKGELKIRPEYTPQIKSWQSFVIYTAKRLLFLCFHIVFLCTSIAANFGCVALRYHSCLDYYDLVREHENGLQQLNLDEMFNRALENEQKQTLDKCSNLHYIAKKNVA